MCTPSGFIKTLWIIQLQMKLLNNINYNHHTRNTHSKSISSDIYFLNGIICHNVRKRKMRTKTLKRNTKPVSKKIICVGNTNLVCWGLLTHIQRRSCSSGFNSLVNVNVDIIVKLAVSAIKLLHPSSRQSPTPLHFKLTSPQLSRMTLWVWASFH